MKKQLRIIFMGTPEFAIPSLHRLLDHGYNIVAVITAQDKPRGRGRKLMPSPVKSFALAHDLPVLQPPNLKSPAFVEELKSFKSNLQVVVAFRMLPEVVWDMPEYGTINLHASLLPDYRGAAPINWVLINGERMTGLTTFFIRHEIDTGNIIFTEELAIHQDDDAGSLHDRMMEKGGELVLKTVKAVENDDFDVKVQQERPGLKRAPKIHREMCEIDWHKKAEDIYNFVRGLSPFPGAWTRWNDKLYKIYKVAVIHPEAEKKLTGAPGTYETDSKSYLNVICGEGAVSVVELQPEGKKRMKVDEFFRGNRL